MKLEQYYSDVKINPDSSGVRRYGKMKLSYPMYDYVQLADSITRLSNDLASTDDLDADSHKGIGARVDFAWRRLSALGDQTVAEDKYLVINNFLADEIRELEDNLEAKHLEKAGGASL